MHSLTCSFLIFNIWALTELSRYPFRNNIGSKKFHSLTNEQPFFYISINFLSIFRLRDLTKFVAWIRHIFNLEKEIFKENVSEKHSLKSKSKGKYPLGQHVVSNPIDTGRKLNVRKTFNTSCVYGVLSSETISIDFMLLSVL